MPMRRMIHGSYSSCGYRDAKIRSFANDVIGQRWWRSSRRQEAYVANMALSILVGHGPRMRLIALRPIARGIASEFESDGTLSAKPHDQGDRSDYQKENQSQH